MTRIIILSGLGCIIENLIIRGSLWQQAQSSTDITLLTENGLKKIILGARMKYL
ncbi:MAG: hypothetical protein ACTS7E_01955 [Arsenophonus sp. NC-CH8-MAG3]